RKGDTLPDWFTMPTIAKYLKEIYPPLKDRGFTIFFTGLSGAGKTTLAKMLMVKLIEHGKRRVTLLDGDIVRTHLSNELGFSKEHRSINVQRIGYVASEITKNGGIAICAPIAPYEADRIKNRQLISQYGIYIEIYLSTPLEVCEHRDIKGFYLRARHNLTPSFTGIDSPYEIPKNADIVLDTSTATAEDLTNKIYDKIKAMGCL
ncbi:MAG: adenylyl-sulfate kinase, partial [Gammaproteobacteria bacterium]|nr:adenylyl-sulfate kinase [Gammaproteobacteria bacterium]